MKPVFYSLGFIFLVFITLALRPVPDATEDQCLITAGIVVDVYEAGTHDINFRLEGSDELFYINRGLESGLNLSEIRAALVGQKVELTYPKHWTPLDPFSKTHHLFKVQLGDQVVFSQFD